MASKKGYVWNGSEWVAIGSDFIDSSEFVTTDTTQEISGTKIASTLKSGTTDNHRSLARLSNFGYSTGGYKALVLGSTSTNYNVNDGAVTLSLGYDPSANTGGQFSGDGSEIMLRNGAKFLTPNAGNTNFIWPMRFNSAGSVSFPEQPSFSAYKGTSGSLSIPAGVIVFDQTNHNTGSHYNTSNGRFTAPVAGKYLFVVHFFLYVGYAETTNTYHQFRLNGSSARISNYGANNYDGGLSLSAIIYMAANDYVDYHVDQTVSTWTGSYQSFAGQLLS